MDTFLHFFLRVFYEIKSKWNAEIMEELGEFPQDIVYMIDEMLNKWRKGEKFAKNIEDAQQRVLDIEKEYKTRVWYTYILLFVFRLKNFWKESGMLKMKKIKMINAD